MSTSAALLNATVGLWLATCVILVFAGKRIQDKYPSILLFIGGATMLVAACLGWGGDSLWNAPSPIYLAVVPLSSRLDSLSSIFIALLGVVTLAVSLFSPAYLGHLKSKINSGCYWSQLLLFIIGMLGVMLAANAITFLVFWELMSLSSVLLIVSDLSSHSARRAAFIYLGATRIATALLMAGFLWMQSITGSWDFAQWRFSSAETVTPALLILIGLCIKAGIWPFHDWLPHAHPAAPSPVSALMSGVMIKVALYAMIRVLVFGGLNSMWLIYLMLGLGIMSAFWGILWALMQQDLKSLLAYSSIENVGLVLIGISLSLICADSRLPDVGAIALASAIFHAFNHGLFKSLLFLGTGTIDTQVHTRDLEKLGGLAARLPWTMLAFVIGSASICALPPFNGFNSKWLIYQSLFRLAGGASSLWVGGMAMICIAVLSLVSGMTLYCFTKAIGISFLGRPRTPAAQHAVEGTPYMLAAQVLLVACCVALGVCAPLAMAVIQPVCIKVFPTSPDLSSVYTIPMWALALLITVLAAGIFKGCLSDANRTKRFVTWECGFGDLTGRMQATSGGFAENIAYTFAPLIRYHALFKIAGRDRRHFPETVSVEVSTKSVFESAVYAPVVNLVRWLGEHLLLLQAGSVHLYLGYILLTLVALMVIGVLI